MPHMREAMLWAFMTGCATSPAISGGPDGQTIIEYPGTIEVTAKVPSDDNVTYESVSDMIPLAVLVGSDLDNMKVLTRGVTGSRLGGIPIDQSFEVRLGTGDFTTEDGYWVFEINGEWRVHERLFRMLSEEEANGAPIDVATHLFAGEHDYRCTVTVYRESEDGVRETEPLIPAQSIAEQWISLRDSHVLIPEDDRTFGATLSETQYLWVEGDKLMVWDEAWESDDIDPTTIFQPIIASAIEPDGDFQATYRNRTARRQTDIVCDTDASQPE